MDRRCIQKQIKNRRRSAINIASEAERGEGCPIRDTHENPMRIGATQSQYQIEFNGMLYKVNNSRIRARPKSPYPTSCGISNPSTLWIVDFLLRYARVMDGHWWKLELRCSYVLSSWALPRTLLNINLPATCQEDASEQGLVRKISRHWRAHALHHTSSITNVQPTFHRLLSTITSYDDAEKDPVDNGGNGRTSRSHVQNPTSFRMPCHLRPSPSP